MGSIVLLCGTAVKGKEKIPYIFGFFFFYRFWFLNYNFVILMFPSFGPNVIFLHQTIQLEKFIEEPIYCKQFKLS